jgi:hypothetical protein
MPSMRPKCVTSSVCVRYKMNGTFNPARPLPVSVFLTVWIGSPRPWPIENRSNAQSETCNATMQQPKRERRDFLSVANQPRKEKPKRDLRATLSNSNLFVCAVTGTSIYIFHVVNCECGILHITLTFRPSHKSTKPSVEKVRYRNPLQSTSLSALYVEATHVWLWLQALERVWKFPSGQRATPHRPG